MSRLLPSHGFFHRAAPALTLVLLAPLVAEYLLGDLRITNLAALPLLACCYGCGALLIREIVRRKGGSWTVYLALAVAYALLAEGIVDQSFFNPDFLHLHALAYGFWPRLGTSPAWAVCVITLHVAWSLAVPIGMTESLYPARSSEPWLGWRGLAAALLLLLLGKLALGSYFYRVASHHASAAQIAVCTMLTMALVILALAWPRAVPIQRKPRSASAAHWLGIFSFLIGSVFIEAFWIGAFYLHWPAAITLSVELGLDLLALWLFCKFWPGRWTPLELCSASTGGLLVYVWHGYRIDRALHGAHGFLLHSLVVVGLCAVQAIAFFRVARFGNNSTGETAN